MDSKISKKLTNTYLAEYYPALKKSEDKKAEEYRIMSLIKKLIDKNSIYKDFPFEFLGRAELEPTGHELTV